MEISRNFFHSGFYEIGFFNEIINSSKKHSENLAKKSIVHIS